MRSGRLSFAVLLLLCAATGLASSAAAGQRTVRDEFGIPHIFGDTDVEMAEEYGFQIARDRLGQLELLRRSALGTLAEVLGPSLVPVDVFIRTHGYTVEERRRMFNALPAELRAMSEAYVRGINRHLREVRALAGTAQAPIEVTLLSLSRVPVADFTVEDLVAIQVFLVRRFGEIGGRELSNLEMLVRLNALDQRAYRGASLDIFNDLRFINDPNAPTTIPRDEPDRKETRLRIEAERTSKLAAALSRIAGVASPEELAEKAALLESQREQVDRLLEQYGIIRKFGSYAWAIAPSKSGTGRALLFGGPQTGFDTPTNMHLVELRSGQGTDAIGMAFVGGPAVLIGKTDNFAWTSTTGVGDNVDVYLEILSEPVSDPLNPPLYLHKGRFIPFAKKTPEPELINVLGGSPVPLQVFRSVHGPVALPFKAGDRSAVVVQREHWMRETETVAGFAAFNKAKTLEEFERAVRMIVTSHNFIYADRLGNIAYWQAGVVRPAPQLADPRLPLVGVGTMEQPDEVIPMPRSVNPAAGFLANWNNKPRVDFDNGDSIRMGKQFRVSRIQELISELLRTGNRLVDFEEMNQINKAIASVTGTGVRRNFLLGYIRRAVDSAPTPARQRALSWLDELWNGHAFGDAVTAVAIFPGEVLFDRWLQIMLRRTFGDELAVAGLPLSLAGWSANFLSSDPNILIHALDEDAGLAGRLRQSYQRSYFDDITTPEVETADQQILASLDEAIASLSAEFGTQRIADWQRPRGIFSFIHPLSQAVAPFGVLPIFFPAIPRSNRATYMQIINANDTMDGIYSMPLGQSGFVALDLSGGGVPRVVVSPAAANLQAIFKNYEFIPMRREKF